MTNGKVLVWDPLVRIFHWTMVAAFTAAYVTGEDAPPLHEWMGYLVLALVLFRMVWGLVGEEHACFADFLRGSGSRCSGTSARRRRAVPGDTSAKPATDWCRSHPARRACADLLQCSASSGSCPCAPPVAACQGRST